MLVNEEKWTWNIQLDRVSMRRIYMLNKLNLVISILYLMFASDALCGAYQKGKCSKSSFKAKSVISTSRPLELLHYFVWSS